MAKNRINYQSKYQTRYYNDIQIYLVFNVSAMRSAGLRGTRYQTT